MSTIVSDFLTVFLNFINSMFVGLIQLIFQGFLDGSLSPSVTKLDELLNGNVSTITDWFTWLSGGLMGILFVYRLFTTYAYNTMGTEVKLATGYSVDIAINHDPEAIRMHKANHPNTKHYCENVWAVDPVKACGGHPVALAWFSPDCKHFSKAKGGKPKDKNIRGLAWVACRWAGLVRPRVIMLENVEEFKTWGPLGRRHHPIKAKQGKTFEKFVQQLTGLGYEVQFRELVAADYGAPTMRKRFFMIARCDGEPIVFPEPTHAPAESEEVKAGLLKPYVGAYTQLDFSTNPCGISQSEFARVMRGGADTKYED